MRRAIESLVVVALFARSAFAQSTSASVTGRITDPSGASVPAATVALVNENTNVRYPAFTNSSGDYYFRNVTPGLFRLEVDKPGFRKIIKPAIVLHVQDALAIDLQMTLGPMTDSVTVEAGAPTVNSQSATVDNVIDRTFVENLPLNGRGLQTLISLTPGVVTTVTRYDDQGQFSVNGQRANANYFTVDGVSANFGATGYLAMVQTAGGSLPALSASGGTNSLAPIDSVEEFRMQTSTFAPEFGRTPGGQISIVTRSGSNTYHGQLFEYFRDDALDASDWFVTASHLPKPEERVHNFGGTFGGPVFRDRTFFFGAYESQRLKQPSTQLTAVPDVASRQLASAAMRPFLDAYPLPNGANLGSGLAEFNASFSNPSTTDSYSLRVDHVINRNATLFGRYSRSPSALDLRGPLLARARVLSLQQEMTSVVSMLTGGVTHALRPAVANEARVNYSSQKTNLKYLLDDFGGAVPLPDSLLFPAPYSSSDSAFQFYIGGAGFYSQGTLGTTEQHQINIVDNLSITLRAHQLKFGVDYRWLGPTSSPFVYRQFAQFSGMSANPGGALSGTAAFAQSSAYQPNTLRTHNLSMYAQDTWTMTSRLTTTYGVRWDINPPLTGKDAENDPFTATGIGDPAKMALAPRGTPLYETTYGNFAPRFGLGFQLSDRPNWDTTLRAGAGIYYDLGSGPLGGTTSYFPYLSDKTLPSSTPFPLSAADAAPPAFSLAPPVGTIVIADRHLKLPRSYQWNVALEQAVGRSQSVSVTYLGAAGRDQLRVTTLFNPNQDFQFVSFTDNSASSDYKALQLKYQRRLSRGLQTTLSYTLAHSEDSASTDAFSTYLNTPAASGADADWGDSDFDIRHSFTLGATYAFPEPEGQGAIHALLSNWWADGAIFQRSAPPVDVVGGVTFASGTALRYRPNVQPGMPLELVDDSYPGGKAFNPAAFTTAPSGQQGDFQRNSLRGFDAWQVDFAVERRLQLTSAVGLRLRLECFNLFNRANFGSPNNDLTSPQFGRSTQTLASSLGAGGGQSGGFAPIYQIGGPRSMQIVLRLQF